MAPQQVRLLLADEVFLTGTAANITPVAEIDRRRIGDGEIGEVTGKLQQAEQLAGQQLLQEMSPKVQDVLRELIANASDACDKLRFAVIQDASLIYLLLVLALIPIITVIGWFGASMTFPVEKE